MNAQLSPKAKLLKKGWELLQEFVQNLLQMEKKKGLQGTLLLQREKGV